MRGGARSSRKNRSSGTLRERLTARAASPISRVPSDTIARRTAARRAELRFKKKALDPAVAQAILRKQRDHLQAIHETVMDAIITIDGRGIIQSTNPAAMRIFGYTACEMIGKNVSMLMPPPYRAKHTSYISRFLRTGEARIIGVGREAFAVRKNGSIFPVDISVGREDGQRIFTGVIRDITERKNAEEQLRVAERLASVGSLAAGLGHDMNNVLLPVRAHLSALMASAKSRSGASADVTHIEQVREGVAYLQHLADGLHFLTTESDSSKRSKVATKNGADLHNWWEHVGVFLSKSVPRNVRVLASFPQNLPHVAIAPHDLTQAVLNLLVNAGEAIVKKKGQARSSGLIRLGADISHDGSDAKSGFVHIHVQDNGIGMSEEVRRRAFEMFFTTKPRGLGTGLGLPIVGRIAMSVGGTVRIESVPNVGSTVTLILPIARTHSSARPRMSAAISVRDARTRGMLQHLLEACHIATRTGFGPGKSNIWIVEPDPGIFDRVRDWQQAAVAARKSPRQVVLVGAVSQRELRRWETLHPVLVERPDDLDMMRQAVRRVAASRCCDKGLTTEKQHVTCDAEE